MYVVSVSQLLYTKLMFNLTDTDEKNDKLKIIIRNKIDEYLGRAEKLKEYLAKGEEPRSRGAVGANGATSGVGGKAKGGDEGDAEVAKLRAGLSSMSFPILTLTPSDTYRT